MPEQTRIDPELLEAINTRLKSVASQLKFAVVDLEGACSRYDGCWGNDKFGQAFAKGYKPGATQLLDNSGKIEVAMIDTTKHLGEALKALQDRDADNSKNL